MSEVEIVAAAHKSAELEPAPAAVDINASRPQIAPGMRIAAHQPEGQMIGESIIDIPRSIPPVVNL